MIKNKTKDWRLIRLTNNRRQQARILRLQRQDYLTFPEHIKMRLADELIALKVEEQQLLKELQNG